MWSQSRATCSPFINRSLRRHDEDNVEHAVTEIRSETDGRLHGRVAAASGVADVAAAPSAMRSTRGRTEGSLAASSMNPLPGTVQDQTGRGTSRCIARAAMCACIRATYCRYVSDRGSAPRALSRTRASARLSASSRAQGSPLGLVLPRSRIERVAPELRS